MTIPTDLSRHCLQLLITLLLAFQVRPSLADELMPQPGNYEITTTSNFGDLPVTQVITSCITAEQLAQDPQKLFAEVPAAQNCEMKHFEMANGRISMHLVCIAEDGEVDMDTQGSYTPQSYDITTSINIIAADTEISTEATVSAIRTGPCEATQVN